MPLARALQGETIREIEILFEKLDGTQATHLISSVPIKIFDGTIVGAIAVAQDITERKQAEKEREQLLEVIQQERDKLSALINSMTDEVWFADFQENFTFINSCARNTFMLNEDEELNVRKFYSNVEVYYPDGSFRPIEESPILRALRGEILKGYEHIIRISVNGEWRHRQINSSPVRDSKGNIFGSVSVVRDITEIKKAEQILIESEASRKVTEAVMAERQLFLDMLEALPVMICLLTPDYHVTFANRSYSEHFGESGDKCCYEYRFGFTNRCELCESYKVLETGQPQYWESNAWTEE